MSSRPLGFPLGCQREPPPVEGPRKGFAVDVEVLNPAGWGSSRGSARLRNTSCGEDVANPRVAFEGSARGLGSHGRDAVTGTLASRAEGEDAERPGERRGCVNRRRATAGAEGGGSGPPPADKRSPVPLAEVREGLAAIARGQAALVRALTRRLGSRADAEDFVQAALLKALTRAGDLRDGTKLVPWFRRILETGLADHARRGAAEARMRSQLARDTAANAPDEGEIWWLSCQCLKAALAAVKREYADVVRRTDLEGIPLRRVALGLGLRPNTAAVRLHRGRRAVVRVMRELCRFCRLHWRLDCACPPAGRRLRPARTPRARVRNEPGTHPPSVAVRARRPEGGTRRSGARGRRG